MGIKENIKIKIQYKDQEYCDALAKALLMARDDFCLVDASKENGPEDLADVITLDENSVPLYQPVSEIVKQIMAKMNRSLRPAKLSKDILYTGFCSAVGGAGLTSTALAYARLKSRLFSREVSFISFDPAYRNDFAASDEYGVSYITELSELKFGDELVLDISYRDSYCDLLDMCERRIVVMGINESRFEAGDKLFNLLAESSRNYINPPENFKFYNHFDQEINEFDIHSQLGKEMLDFINKIDLQGNNEN